jgi:RNA polymerase sigma factor (sigma-70 family)
MRNQSGGLFVDGHMSRNTGASVADNAGRPLAELFASEREGLRRLARLLTGSDAMAEDLVQEAFVRLQASHTAPANRGGYLRTVLVNLCRDHLRRQARARYRAVPVPLVQAPPEVDETWAAVCRLPFRQRAAVVLRYYQDLPEAEIANLLGCRPGTVKSSLSRALAKLRKELSP